MAVLRPLLERAVERLRPTPLLKHPLIIGHRGASGEAPENTLTAFDLALRQGADGIEFDVHLSADEVPVVIHDARLERTTSGSGWVREHTVSKLKRLDAGSWFSRLYPSRARARFQGLRIPLLAEVLAWVRERKCQAFVEIKKDRRSRHGIESKVLADIARTRTAELATVISFDFPTLRRLRQLDSRIRLGIDFTRPVLAVRRAKLIQANCILPYWAFASRRFIRRCHRARIAVVVWDLDQPRWMRRRLLDGVDGVITNCPATLHQICAVLKGEL